MIEGVVKKKKPSSNNYFTQETEDAIVAYNKATSTDEKAKIYHRHIHYAFFKLTENIIHTFKFYYTDTDTIEELKHEVVTFLLEKLHLYNQSKGKAYSYFGTIAKRYLIVYNENNYKKLQEKVDIANIDEDESLPYEHIHEPVSSHDIPFIDQYVKYIDTHLFTLFPKKQDAQTADSIIELFRKRESIEIFNKKALYIYIREQIDVSTPHITKISKKLKLLYVKLYNEWYEHGYIKI